MANSHDKLDKALKGYKDVADKARLVESVFSRVLKGPGVVPGRVSGGGKCGEPPNECPKVRGFKKYVVMKNLDKSRVKQLRFMYFMYPW